MAQNPKLVPAEYPEHIQKFLFACAFWIVAADEQLTQGEQRWLTDQFGPRKTAAWLEEMTGAQGTRFYPLFDKLTAALGENDRRRIYPGLMEWLSSCAASDVAGAAAEADVLGRIKARLTLDEQLARIMRAQGKMTQSASTQAAPRPKPFTAPSAPVPASAPIPDRPQVRPEQEHPPVVTAPARAFRGHGGEVTCACFGSRGDTAFSGSADSTVRSWDVSSGVETRTFAEQEAGISALACSPDGMGLFSGNMAGVVIRWNAGSGGRVWQVTMDNGDGVTAVAVSGDGSLVAVARQSGIVTVMQAADGRAVRTPGPIGGAARDLCFSRNGRLMVCGGDDKSVKTWDGVGAGWTNSLVGHQEAVLAVRISPDGKLAASGSADKTVKLWDVSAGKELRTLAGHAAAVHGLDLSHDGLSLVSASGDGIVKAWEISTGRQIQSVRVSAGRLGRVACHPSGNSALICGADHVLYLIEHVASQLSTVST